ncbi:MAG TPA: hypothetical protein VG797_08640 [Phycisphaerales bacterium]|nr:hypothetical protein [Phycisphaerales bacterium]
MKFSALCFALAAALLGLTAAAASAQTISITSTNIRVGSGLQDGGFTVHLSTTTHGGVTVHIAASDPFFTVGSATAAAGTASIDRFIPNGQSDTTFYVNGTPGMTGVGTVTATATGFTGDSESVTIITPVFRCFETLTGLNEFSASTLLRVQIGIPNAAGTAFQFAQSLAQGPSLAINVSNSNASIAQLVTSSGSSQNATITIAPGNSITPPSLAAGGLFFDPLLAGSTTVTAAVSGFTAFTGDNVRNVSIAAPTLSVINVPARLGSGLQEGPATARLSGTGHGGRTIHVASSDPSRILISTSSTVVGASSQDIVVADGATDATFYMQALSGVTGDSTITASTTGVDPASGTVSVVTPALRYVAFTTTISALSPDVVVRAQTGILNAAGTAFGTIQDVRAGSSVTVNFANSNASVARFDTLAGVGQTATATIAAATNATPSTRAAGGVEFDPIGVGTTMLTCSSPGFTFFPAAGETVTITPGTLSIVSAVTRMGAGMQDGPTTARLSGSGHGGTTIRITSGDPSKLLIAPNATTVGSAFIDVAVADGAIDAPYFVQTIENVTGTVTVTASSPLAPDATSNIDIVAPSLRILDLTGTISAVGANQLVRAQCGVLNAAGTSFNGQNIRAGASLVVTFNNSTSSVAQLVTQALTGQSVAATIPANANVTPSTLVAGGVFFDPLGVGSTTITLAASGYTQFPVSGFVENVTPGTLQFFSLPVNVGAGLQDGPTSARLSGSGHGGTTIRVQSTDPSKLLVAPNATTVGSAFLDYNIPNGQTDATFFVMGVAGATPGSVSIEATSPAATMTSAPVNIVQPAVRLLSMPTNVASTSADVPFRIQVGLPNQFGTDLLLAQNVAGGPPLDVTVTNSNAIAARLTTSAGSAQSRLVQIQPNLNSSAATVASGGIAFDPLSSGDTIVTASIPGFLAVSTSTAPISVRCPGDADFNGSVGLSDIAVLVSHWGFAVVPGTDGDLNFSGTVGLEDIAIAIQNWTLVCP